MPSSLTCQRAQFSLPPELHYLNTAYMAPLPRTAQQAGIEAIARKANPTTISAPEFFEATSEVRRLFAEIISGQAERVAIVPAVSYGIATAARNTSIVRGQNIVVSAEQFPSNVYTWRKLAAASGATLRVVQPPSNFDRRGSEWNSRLLEAIDAGTALIALPHVHWTDG